MLWVDINPVYEEISLRRSYGGWAVWSWLFLAIGLSLHVNDPRAVHHCLSLSVWAGGGVG